MSSYMYTCMYKCAGRGRLVLLGSIDCFPHLMHTCILTQSLKHMKYVSEYEMYELVQAQYITSNTVSRSTERVSMCVCVCLSHRSP